MPPSPALSTRRPRSVPPKCCRATAAEGPEGPHEPVEARPVARRPSRPAVHDEILGPLGHLRIEVVHEHPERGLLGPSPAGQPRPPGGAYLPRPPYARRSVHAGGLSAP